MKVILNDESFFYEAQQVAMLFFPENDDVLLECDIKCDGKIFSCSAEISAFGKKGKAQEKGTFSLRRDKADIIKKSVYFACKKISDTNLPWGILTGIRPAKPIRQMIDDGKKTDDIRTFLKENYYVSEEKINLAIKIAETENKFISKDKNAVSVYVGIPFCPTRCSYCSFISQDAGKMIKLSADYTELLLREMEKTAEILNKLGLYARSIYFGGGTPTALCEAELEKVLNGARNNFYTDKCLEFTVEAGRPDTVNPEKLQIIKESGAGRISINPQTIHDKTLETIGRKHTFDEFEKAFYLARGMGFDNINCDLIAGLPGENVSDFEKSVDKIFSMSPENITVHTLYLKRASNLKKEGFSAEGHSEIAEMVNYAQQKLSANGFNPYYLYKQKATLGNLENVGFSKDGFECIYNIDTMSDESTVFALGGGAVTKIVMGDRIERVFNFKNADEYIKRFDEIIDRKMSIINFFGE